MKNFNIIYFLFLSLFAVAQAPQKINYQGVARDNSGNILPNQSIGLRISLHSGSSSGPVVYQETHATSTNTFGLFNLEIGNGGVVSGTFNTIGWGTNTYYIQVEMDATGGTSYSNMGTSQLVSVPYALYAEQAGNANTYTAGTGIAINNNIITNTAPDTDDQTLSVSGNTLSINGGNSVTIPSYWTANGNHIYNNNSGNVGIGTTAPTNPLVIEYSASTGEGRNLVKIKNPSTGTASYGGIKFEAGSTQTNDPLLLIGMHAETYTLNSGYANYGQVWSTGNGLIIRASDAVGSSYTPDIRFQTQTIPPADGAYDRMIITHEGNVGIGTTAPTNPLVIEHSASTGEARNLINVKNPSTGTSSYGGIKFEAGSTQTNDPILLVGMHAETYTLNSGYADYGQVWSTGNGLIIRASDAVGSSYTPDIRFQTQTIPPANGAYDRMIITHEGNVGIGTTTPTSKLYIEHSSSSGDERNILTVNNPSTGAGSVAGIKVTAGSSQNDEGFMLMQFHSETYSTNPNYDDYGQILSTGNGLILRASDNVNLSNHPHMRFQTGFISSALGSYDRMVITHEGNIGIGTTTPQAKLQLTDGDFYLDNSTNGVIIKSPNGSCWKITVNDSGVLSTVSVTCP